MNFLFAYEFILIVDHFSVVLFKFFSDVVHVGNPFRTRSELRNKETTDFRVIQSCQKKTAVFYNCKHTDRLVRLNTGEKSSIAVSNLDLFLVAKKNILLCIVHEMNRIYGFIIGRFD